MVPGPPGPAGGVGQELGRRAGREYNGPGGAGATQRLSLHAADPTEAAWQLGGFVSASRATVTAVRVEMSATAGLGRSEGGPAGKVAQPSEMHRPAHTSSAQGPDPARLP